MSRQLHIALALLTGSTCVAAAPAQERAANPDSRIELRWVESKRVEGLTEDEGFQSSCDPDSIVYPHKKAALVLTAAEVTEARLRKHDFSGSGLSSANYLVTLVLTKGARSKLAATYEGDRSRLLTVVVDGKCWGLRRYVKDKDQPFVPVAARAETFTPDVGFFSSRSEAERLVNALRANEE